MNWKISGNQGKLLGKFGMIDKDFWKKKTVLVTGHTGFKGSWLSIWLIHMGANVVGYSLDPYSKNDNYVLSRISDKIIDIRADIRDGDKLKEILTVYKPEIVIHLAAQPIVRVSYDIPLETYQINVMGTINLLEAIRHTDNTKACLVVTSDKCYKNCEKIFGYREEDPLGGFDPYSSSKGATEIVVNSWRSSYFNPQNYSIHGTSIASARAGNVIGGGDWSTDRLVPDIIKNIEKGNNIEIRNPDAVRPWQHVLEPLAGYLLLVQKMFQEPSKFSEPYNFGPENSAIKTVWEISHSIVKEYGRGKLVNVSRDEKKHEAKLLTLDNTKARWYLGWTPRFTIEETVQLTVDWYKRYKIDNVFAICKDQIEYYNSRCT